MRIKDGRSNALDEDDIIGHKTLAALNKKAALVKRGDKSDLVKWIQIKLGVSADGVYGDNPYHETFDLVCAFQSSRGLEVDGIIGPNTWVALVKQ